MYVCKNQCNISWHLSKGHSSVIFQYFSRHGNHASKTKYCFDQKTRGARLYQAHQRLVHQQFESSSKRLSKTKLFIEKTHTVRCKRTSFQINCAVIASTRPLLNYCQSTMRERSFSCYCAIEKVCINTWLRSEGALLFLQKKVFFFHVVVCSKRELCVLKSLKFFTFAPVIFLKLIKLSDRQIWKITTLII